MMKLNIRLLAIVSAICGFLIIPVHEFGHVVGDWITGHPAGMSYARDYLLNGGEKPFFGILSGPLLPLVFCVFAIIAICKRKNLAVSYPIAIIGSLDRLVFYLMGILPSDERELANLAGWNSYSFEYIFCTAETAVLLLVVISMFRYRLALRQGVLVFFIPIVSFVVGVAIGVYGVERLVFPSQFKLQFGQ